ncbi:MAG: adenosylcobalamin-dependent ribonucleoside-diphosphate reductase [Candidatus Sumerlaeales bacterium]|nr:adenosylcobalamin-dependent ribonucleoside-diphosphate reductase [Candidatus Sumerlaeales bacterium]
MTDTRNLTVEDWLGKNNTIGIDVFKRKYLRGDETLHEWFDRVSNGNPWLRQLIVEKKFLFGGRVLANRGTDTSGSLSNCYSVGSVQDDYAGIMDVAKQIGLTYKGQGGQGLSISGLRPKGTPVGKDYTSDGIVPFMKIFNEVTDSTAQGGSRKGALMISLDARHKEALNFITVKSGQHIIEKANLSLELDDDFMGAVQKWYEMGEEVILHEKRTYSGHEIEYDVVPIKIFQALVDNSWDWGDPACLFINEFRNYNIMEFVNEYNIITANPCGEQPLPAHGACCLGSINLSAFVSSPFTQEATFDFTGFAQAVQIAVRALDEIVEENLSRHPLIEQTEMARNYRNIGLGAMGYADALMMLQMKYGSKDAINFTDYLFREMFRTAVKASSNRAIEKGSFPKYDSAVWNSRIIKKHFCLEEIIKLKNNGLRNCSVLSIAPNGSLSTFLGISGGVEPEYAIKYTRRTVGATDGKDTLYDVYCMTAQKYFEQYPNKTELPDYFVTSAEIPFEKRIETQACMQRHVDTAISSTINLPQSATKDDVAKIYLLAWQNKLKGITVFRDGCKKLGILTTPTSQQQTEAQVDNERGLRRGDILQHSNNNIIKSRTIQSGCGKVYVHAHFDPDTGELGEFFLDRGAGGGCERYMNGLSRMTSLAARGGVGTSEIIDQMLSVSQCAAYISRRIKHKDASKGACCPNAIGYVIQAMWDEVKNEMFDDEDDDTPAVDNIEQVEIQRTRVEVNNSASKQHGSKCPECGLFSLTSEGGCNVCKACGYSRCD